MSGDQVVVEVVPHPARDAVRVALILGIETRAQELGISFEEVVRRMIKSRATGSLPGADAMSGGHVQALVELRAELVAVADALSVTRARLVAAVDAARADGVRWVDVAEVLGHRSPQSVQAWHKRAKGQP